MVIIMTKNPSQKYKLSNVTQGLPDLRIKRDKDVD
jgi:hypothetical protein